MSTTVSAASIGAVDLTASNTRLLSQKPTGAAEIRHAAGEFESILLGQWLQGAESSFGNVPGGEDDEDAGEEQMKGFAVQALAKGLTAAGGIGLASMVAKALVHSSQAATPGSSSPPAGDPK